MPFVLQHLLSRSASLGRSLFVRASKPSTSRRAGLLVERLESRELLSAAFDITGLTALRADSTYNQITGKNVGIAILDTGLFAGHPALSQNVKAWFDAVQNVARPGVDPAPLTQAFDREGHGTHVSGTAASSNPEIGVAYGAKLIGVRALPDDGERSSVVDTVLNALNWVLYNADNYNIRVVNMSLGVPSTNINGDLNRFDTNKQKEAIDKLEAKGIVVVTASGNRYGNFASPGAAVPAVFSTISVANTWSEYTPSDPDFGQAFGAGR
jgi:serine protease AprX